MIDYVKYPDTLSSYILSVHIYLIELHYPNCYCLNDAYESYDFVYVAINYQAKINKQSVNLVTFNDFNN